MKNIFLFLCLVFAASLLYAGEQPLAVFGQANAAYEKGDFRTAIRLYESLAAQREVNAPLFFNLGNAYYRDQQPGRAILNYERALRLAPRDADIRFNLRFVRDAVKEPPLPFLESVAEGLVSTVRLNTLVALCSALFILLAAGTIAFLFSRSRLALAGDLVLLLLLLACAGWLYLKADAELFTRQAVIVAGPADVRNSPEHTGSVGFTLPEGRSVVILSEKDEWFAVGLPVEGLKGWLEKKYVEAV